MYGADITKLHAYMIERALHQPKGEIEQTRWGVEVEGVLVGLAVQHWWAIMPLWSIGGLFFRNTTNRNQFNAVKIGAVLVNGMIDEAEKRGLYDFCYVVRDSGNLRRDMSLAVNEKLGRYDILNTAYIKPFEVPRWSAYRLMLGLLAGKNRKPVIIRHAHLKSEHRPVW